MQRTRNFIDTQFKGDHLLFLNTNDGLYGTPYDQEWEIRSNVLQSVQDFDIRLKDIQFPNAVYPINRFNNRLYFQEEGGSLFTAVIPVGNYNGTTFAAAVTVAMDGVSTHTYKNVYDTTTFTIKTSIVGNTPAFRFIPGDFSCMVPLGYTNFQPTEFSLQHIAPYPVHLSGTRFVYLLTNLTAGKNYSTTNQNSVLDKVPIDVPFGEEVVYEPNNENWVNIADAGLDNIHIRLVDQNGNNYELPNNTAMALTFMIRERGSQNEVHSADVTREVVPFVTPHRLP